MSQDFIAGKRYPRGMRRIMRMDGGKKNPAYSYYDLSKVKQNKNPEEYNKTVVEMRNLAKKSP